MASPQLENGFFKIANELAEALAGIRISGQESQVVWAVLRKTYGYGKKQDQISHGQISSMTKIRRTKVVKLVQSLVSKKVLGSTNNGTRESSTIWINKNYEEWLHSPKKDTSPNKGTSSSTNIGTKTSTNKGTHKRQKTKKDIPAKILPADIRPEFLELSRLYHQEYHKRFPSLLKSVPQKLIENGANTIQRLVEIEKYDMEAEIKPALRFALNDDFWQKQIRSLAGLRKKSSRNGETKFANLLAASMRNGSKPKPKIHPIDEIL